MEKNNKEIENNKTEYRGMKNPTLAKFGIALTVVGIAAVFIGSGEKPETALETIDKSFTAANNITSDVDRNKIKE